MRQRSEVAARAHRAFLGDDGDDVALEQRDEQVQRALADPLYPPASTFARSSMKRADGRSRKRGPCSCRVRQDQVALTCASRGARWAPRPAFRSRYSRRRSHAALGQPIDHPARRPTRSRAAGAISTRAPPAAAKATCSRVSELPSMTMRPTLLTIVQNRPSPLLCASMRAIFCAAAVLLLCGAAARAATPARR